jgi:hypothetical protein
MHIQHDKSNKKIDKTTTTLSHTQEIYTARLLDFKNLPEPKIADDNPKIISSTLEKTSHKTFNDLEPGCK